MKILVVDEADGSTDVQDIINRYSPDQTIRLAGMCNGIGQVMSDITHLAPLHGLTKLIIKGHGDSGLQGIGIGKGSITFANGSTQSVFAPSLPKSAQWQFSVLNLDYLSDPANSQAVSLIAPYFNAQGSAELYGCHTGDGPSGQELLKRLSKLWNVPASASTWFNLKQSSNLAGTVITAYPDGHTDTRSWLNPDSPSQFGDSLTVGLLEGWRRLANLF